MKCGRPPRDGRLAGKYDTLRAIGPFEVHSVASRPQPKPPATGARPRWDMDLPSPPATVSRLSCIVATPPRFPHDILTSLREVTCRECSAEATADLGYYNV